MAGIFPEGREYNVYCDASSSSFVVNHWPTEIIFCGFEIGYNIITGRRVSRSLPAKEMEDLLEQYMMHCPKH